MIRKKVRTPSISYPNSSSTYGGNLVGTVMATMDAVYTPVLRFKIVFATQFCIWPKPLFWYSLYAFTYGAYS